MKQLSRKIWNFSTCAVKTECSAGGNWRSFRKMALSGSVSLCLTPWMKAEIVRKSAGRPDESRRGRIVYRLRLLGWGWFHRTGRNFYCYEVTSCQVVISPKYLPDFRAILPKGKSELWRHMSGIRRTDSGLSHSVIRGLVTDRLMTTP